jgi:hypothetical protein
MPLLFEHKKFTEIIPESKSFKNAYIADFDRPQNDNKIVLVFDKKQKDLPEINQVEHYTRAVKGVELYFYVYDIPENLSDNYMLWLLGNYSKFSEKAKQAILYFWDVPKSSLTYGVLYKTGAKIKKFFKDNFEKEFDERFTNPGKDWWFEPTLSKEIYGAE